MSQTVTICSIYFRDLEATRDYSIEGRVILTPQPNGEGGGFKHRFFIPACAPGKFELLRVGKMFELQRNGSQFPTSTAIYPDGMGGLADCLVREWREFKTHSNHGKPGVFVCEGDEPSREELAIANLSQTGLAEALCGEADDLYKTGLGRLVHGWHRDAAAWMGRMQYPWLHNDGQIIYQECPLCASKVDSRAVRCPSCSATLDFKRFEAYEMERIEHEYRMAEIKRKFKPEPIAAPVK